MSSEGPSELGESAPEVHGIVVVDSRDPNTAPLADLLASARALGVAICATTLEHALEGLRSASPGAVLVHLGVDPRAGGGGGALLALELRRRAPSLPMVLYTGNPDPASAPALSSLGPSTPIVRDTRLLSDLSVVLSRAARAADRSRELRSVIARLAARTAAARRHEFPPGFRILRFQGEIERAVVLLALQSRATGHEAAAAIGTSERSLARLIDAHGLHPRSSNRPAPLSSAVRMAWVHPHGLAARAGLSGEASGVELLHLAPGELSPRRLEPADICCALVSVGDAAAAVDAWKLGHAPRDIPWAMHGSLTTPLAVLLSILGLPLPLGLDDEGLHEVAAAVARAGAACRELASAIGPVPGMPERSSGELLNLDRVVEQTCDGIILAALAVACTEARAAALVGLAPRTFAYRAKQARTRRERGCPPARSV